jgi:hypothetical protein
MTSRGTPTGGAIDHARVPPGAIGVLFRDILAPGFLRSSYGRLTSSLFCMLTESYQGNQYSDVSWFAG